MRRPRVSCYPSGMRMLRYLVTGAVAGLAITCVRRALARGEHLPSAEAGVEVTPVETAPVEIAEVEESMHREAMARAHSEIASGEFDMQG